ncbi:hypothetical protein ACP6EV_19770 [Aeromonas hydrophila]|uniref:hypothetical protein n=1 Tax=Aeromonas hydrophila TaxID=644 RepID=UPI003CF7D9A6
MLTHKLGNRNSYYDIWDIHLFDSGVALNLVRGHCAGGVWAAVTALVGAELGARIGKWLDRREQS